MPTPLSRFTHPARITDSPLATAFRLAVIALAVHGGLDLSRGVLAQETQPMVAWYLPRLDNAAQATQTPHATAEPPRDLETRVAALEYVLEHVSRNGDTIVVTGANLQVVSGSGATDVDPNGLGNIIIGYNEGRAPGPSADAQEPIDRSGSHMLVVGMGNTYSYFGGIVAGRDNTASGEFSSVCGGISNQASGQFSLVAGGEWNVASGHFTSVLGGYGNEAGGELSTVSGGNTNVASGDVSAVAGGRGNAAIGFCSSVSGGHYRTAPGEYNWVAGSLLEER
jgi:hypothetical protein